MSVVIDVCNSSSNSFLASRELGPRAGNAEIAGLDIAGLDNGKLDIDGLDNDGRMCG